MDPYDNTAHSCFQPVGRVRGGEESAGLSLGSFVINWVSTTHLVQLLSWGFTTQKMNIKAVGERRAQWHTSAVAYVCGMEKGYVETPDGFKGECIS